MVDNPSGGAPEVCYIYDTIESKILDNTVDGIQTAGTAFNRIWWITGSGAFGYSDHNFVANNVNRNASIGVRSDSGARDNNIGPNDNVNITTPYSDANVSPFTNEYTSPSVQSNANPNGAGVVGVFGQRLFDTVTNTIYMCTSYPQGAVWQII